MLNCCGALTKEICFTMPRKAMTSFGRAQTMHAPKTLGGSSMLLLAPLVALTRVNIARYLYYQTCEETIEQKVAFQRDGGKRRRSIQGAWCYSNGPCLKLIWNHAFTNDGAIVIKFL